LLRQRVLVTGSTQKTADAAREELGKNAIVMVSDATVLAHIDALAARAQSEFGAVDFLFINAGCGKIAPFESTPEAVYDEMFNLNMKGTVLRGAEVCSADAFRKRDRAHDIHREREGDAQGERLRGRQSRPPFPRAIARGRAYAARHPRQRHQPRPIDTPVILKAGLPKEQMEQMHKKMQEAIPMKRHGRPEEIAKET
jgi:NAD(P)-dependent dehydrogenase (short-subunit alcohol dehydrogenase family)